MRTNHTKDKLLRGETVYGCALQHFRSAEVPRVFAAAGFDYVFIDAEHTGFDLETLQDMVATSAQAGITPLVRPGELLYSLVARVLDIGAQGLIFPRVECPKLLEEAISWTRFPPHGKRGFGIMPPLLDYERRTFPEIMEHLNANTLVVVQFETRTAIERCEELLAVPGVDVAMIGPSDLSISLGVAGQFDSPVLADAVARLIAACERRRVVPGIQCRSSEQALHWVESGMRLVGVGSDLSLLMEKSQETVSLLHNAPRQPAPAPR
ncbi:MAG: aldolase/citrate lyase family protein [Bryobacteraceae bacterium]|jgi:2-dehydro-3-deoxyglucarate aldolase/4-hydroxy-2-oxoheptanedioate aldolase